MEHGDYLKRERCKTCQITFPDVTATEDLVRVPFNTRMLTLRYPPNLVTSTSHAASLNFVKAVQGKVDALGIS
jgi:hypothetical protein